MRHIAIADNMDQKTKELSVSVDFGWVVCAKVQLFNRVFMDLNDSGV